VTAGRLGGAQMPCERKDKISDTRHVALLAGSGSLLLAASCGGGQLTGDNARGSDSGIRRGCRLPASILSGV
jgi:hypothetical protein